MDQPGFENKLGLQHVSKVVIFEFETAFCHDDIRGREAEIAEPHGADIIPCLPTDEDIELGSGYEIFKIVLTAAATERLTLGIRISR